MTNIAKKEANGSMYSYKLNIIENDNDNLDNIEVMKELHNLEVNLNAAKTKFDSLLRDPKFIKVWLLSDPFKYYKKIIVKSINVEFVSNAWFKMYELCTQFKLFDTNKEVLETFHNAEFPGNFIIALNHFVYTKTKVKCLDWKASSYINPEEGTLPDSLKLYELCKSRWMMDKYKNNGDTTNMEVIKNFPKNVDLYTADAGIDVSSDYNKQEELLAKINLGSVLAGLLSLKIGSDITNVGGSFINKQFTWFKAETISLIYIIFLSFDSVYITKPVSSRALNSEIYLVGLGYKGISDDIKNKMIERLSPLTINSSSKLDSLESKTSDNKIDTHIIDVPISFINQLVKPAKDIYETQINKINEMIGFYQEYKKISKTKSIIKLNNYKESNPVITKIIQRNNLITYNWWNKNHPISLLSNKFVINNCREINSPRRSPRFGSASVRPQQDSPRTSSLSDILIIYNSNKYNTNESIEVEYIFVVTPDQFRLLITSLGKFSESYSFTDSVNFIGRDCIRSVSMPSKKETNYKKILLMKTIFVTNKDIKYKINVKKEILVKECLRELDFARLKSRLSIVLDKKWKYDLTIVKEIDKKYINNTLKKESDLLFTKDINSIGKFLEAKKNQIDTYKLEFEIEFVGDKLELHDFDDPIKKVSEILSIQILNPEYQQKLYEIAKKINPNNAEFYRNRLGFKNLVEPVLPLTKKIYLDLLDSKNEFFVTHKVDGERCIVHFTNDEVIILSSNLERMPIKTSEEYIFEGEITTIMKKDEAGEITKSHSHLDIYLFNTLYPPMDSFSKKLDKIIEICESNIMSNLKCKKFEKYESSSNIESVRNDKRDYEIDGLIFVTNDRTYKWKFEDKNTIDFLIKKHPEEEDTYILMCGINVKEMNKDQTKLLPFYDKLIESFDLHSLYPIPFSPPDSPFVYIYHTSDKTLNNKIGEFIWIMNGDDSDSTKNGYWKLVKIRDDRNTDLMRGNYFGNYYKVALSIWSEYKEPFTYEMLIDPSKISLGYFKEKSDKNIVQRRFNSYVKYQIYEKYSNNFLIDLASGNGQDLGKANKYFKSALFIDKDQNAMNELLQRYDNKINIPIKTLVVDLNTDYRTILEETNVLSIKTNSADVIICNFAFHYLFDSKKTLENIIQLIHSLLKVGGYFIFTAFNGEKVFNLLEQSNSDWSYKDETREYSIKRKYKDKNFLEYGQKIEVVLPFSSEEYYEENLINLDVIIKDFTNHNFLLKENESFEIFLKEYPNLNLMNDYDKTYVSLYSYVVFQKIK